MKQLYVIFVLMIIFLFSCESGKPPVDLIIYNGNIITLDDQTPNVQALAAGGGKILAIGSDEKIKSMTRATTRMIDLESKTAIPGLIEGHAHFMSFGYSKMKLRLNETKNWREIVTMVNDAAKSAEPGEWILGRGWHQEKWDEVPAANVSGYPVHDLLSKAAPQNPVFLTHASGHGIITNRYAMELAGITSTTPDPSGGAILHKSNHEPAGVFLENADTLITNRYTEFLGSLSAEQITARNKKAFMLANQGCLEFGITGFHDAGVSFKEIDFYKDMVDANLLGVRLWVMLEEENDRLKESISSYKIKNYGDHHLTVGGIKRYMDGALGAHGAWLIEPYNDLPDNRGLNTIDLKVFEESAEIAIQNGFQLCTHAIGDLGNRKTLDIYEKTFNKYPQYKDVRWRVEHAQHLHPDDIGRFAKLGIIPVMQSVHCTSDGPWVLKKLGERRSQQGAYVWRDLMKAGSIISNGTDAPVESINPYENFYSAITRKMAGGEPFFPDQRMTREEALRSYTINAAYSAFEEEKKGTLSVGKLADITVLSKNIMTVPEDEISKTEAVYTIIGGEVLYQK